MNYYGQLDLTALGNIIRQHPQLVKEVTFQDGTTHKFINIDIQERRQPSSKGHTHYCKVGCKKDEQVEGLKYYIADLKTSNYGTVPQYARPQERAELQPAVQAPLAPAQANEPTEETNDLPF